MATVKSDSIKLINQDKKLLQDSRDNLIPAIDDLVLNLQKDSADVKDSEYKGVIASTAQGDSQVIAQEFATFLENTNVDELFMEASTIENRLMQGEDIGWLEHSPWAPATPGNYPNIVDPQTWSETLGSADEFGGYLQMSGDDVTKDYGYTMGVVSDADVYNPFWIDEKITHSWPAEPERAFILPESDPALYENYMNYFLQTNEEGIYVHDQKVVDQALIYKDYLTKYDNLQNIIHDTYLFNYDMPHFILPSQEGTRTQQLGGELIPDIRSGDPNDPKSLWELPQFQDPNFRADYGAKSVGIFSPFEFHDIVEKLEGAPEGSAVGKAYHDYLNLLDQAQDFVYATQGMRTNDLERYTHIRNLLNYKGKGFGEGDVSSLGLGRSANYVGDRDKNFRYSGFQSLENYEIEPDLPYGSGWYSEEEDYRNLQQYPQDLVNILSSLKELE